MGEQENQNLFIECESWRFNYLAIKNEDCQEMIKLLAEKQVLEQEFVLYKETYEKLTEDVVKIKADMRAEFELFQRNNESELIPLKSERDLKIKENQVLRQEKETLLIQVENEQKKVLDKEEETITLRQDYEVLKRESLNVQDKKKSLEMELDKLENLLTEQRGNEERKVLYEENSSLQKVVQELNDENERGMEERRGLEEEERKEEATIFHNECYGLRKQIDNLEGKLEQAEKSIKEMKNDLKKSLEVNQMKESRIGSLYDEVEREKMKNQTLESTKQKLQNQITALKRNTPSNYEN